MKFVSSAEVSTLYEIVVIGGGPTGLAASLSFSQDRSHSVLLVESGKEFENRDRYDANDMTVGMGGAGLFSDGKFSFYPSSSILWKKLAENYDTLIKSYEEVKAVLSAQGLNVPEFPSLSETTDTKVFNEWFLKEYPSFYLDLQQRQNLISLMQNSSPNIVCCVGSMMSECIKSNSGEFLLSLEDTNTGHIIRINTKNVLYCGGRFGSLSLRNHQLFAQHMKFHRLELGFRIEQHTNESFFVKETTLTDPKFKFVDPTGDVEWRTFCACKDGETVLSSTQGLWTVSGRADCEPSGKSNIGLNTRLKDSELAMEVLKHVVCQTADRNCYFDIPLIEFLTGKANPTIDAVVSKPMRKYMKRGLRLLVEKFPALLTSPTARLKGPTIEGVGWYPELDSQLKVEGMNFWVAGDAAGCFRGITSALISGFYAAEMIKTKIKEGT